MLGLSHMASHLLEGGEEQRGEPLSHFLKEPLQLRKGSDLKFLLQTNKLASINAFPGIPRVTSLAAISIA